MVTLVVPNVVQVAIDMQCSGQQVVNVLHFRYGAGSGFFGSQVLADVKTAWEKTGGPLKLKGSQVQMVQYRFTDLGSLNGTTGQLASTATGAVTGSLATMASSALLKLSSGTRNRSSSGRLYHGPLMEQQIGADGRSIDAPFAATLQTAYNTFRSDLALVGLQWCVVSRKNSTSALMDQISVSPIIATQRRRQR